MPEDRHRAAVLGYGREGLDRNLERGLRVEAEVALFGEGRVHEDERQLPRARFAPLGIPEAVRVRGARAETRPWRPAAARVVPQPRRAQLGREPLDRKSTRL